MARPVRPRRAARALALVATFAVVLVGSSWGVVSLLRSLDGDTPPATRCTATVDGSSWALATDQAETAALLAGTSLRRGMPARAVTIALATGMQESRLRNIDHGDRDSVGIFQQRPSQGWGTVEQIMDPVYSTNTFYDALARVDGYEQMEITVAAQTVQRSGFPDAYAQHESLARAWASALTGHSPGALTCTLRDAATGDPVAVADRLARDLGLTASVGDDGVVLVDAAGLPGAAGDPARGAWAVAQWAVAAADPLEVVHVAVGEHTWTRDEGAWSAATTPVGAGQVAVRVAAE